jgi:hypothetical protein
LRRSAAQGTIAKSAHLAKNLPGRFVVGFDGVRYVEAQVAELDPEGLPRDAQQPGRLMLIPARELEHAR